MKTKKVPFLISIVAMCLVPSVCFAATVPWEGFLGNVQAAMTGSTARYMTMIGIAAYGMTMLLGEAGGFMRRAGFVSLGGVIALNAPRFVDFLS